MKRTSRILTVTATAILVLTLGIWGSSWLNQQAQAQTEEEEAAQETTATERTITVSGQGRINVQPDTAVVRLGVQTQADTAQAALDENSQNMQAVISTTLEAGVAEEDVQTQGIRLQPVYDQSEGDQQPQVAGYRASNIVEVTVRDLDNVGSLLDAVVGAGSNTIENIRFEVSDTDQVLAQAREAAVNNAREKAEQLTSLLDAELDEVLTIRETGATPPTPVALETVERAAAAVPVQPGTQSVEASVEITWLIR